MQKSSPAKTGRRAATLLPAAALLAVLTCPMRPSSYAFATSGASPVTPRRRALGSLLPVLLPVAPLAASADEKQDEKKEKRVVQSVVGGGKVSYVMPPDAQDWVLDKKIAAEKAYEYDRKDGAILAVATVPPGYVSGRHSEAGPGTGFRVLKYQVGEKQDDLQWRHIATISRGAAGGGALIGGFLFSDGDPNEYYQFLRVLHGPKGDVVVSIAVPLEKIDEEGPKLQKVIDSFRLEA